MRRRVTVDDEGRLLDRATMMPPDDLAVALKWHHDESPVVSPIAGFIPAEMKAKFPGAAGMSDYAHFTLTVRAGDDRQRRAMVDRWTGKGAGRERGPWHGSGQQTPPSPWHDRTTFCPSWSGASRTATGSPFERFFSAWRCATTLAPSTYCSGPAARQAIEDMRFLRPSQVPGAIPRLIDRLTDDDHVTRALAEESLRIWTGQAFGHTWKGYDYQRPTPAEGRAMQELYKSWWQTSRATFRARLH